VAPPQSDVQNKVVSFRVGAHGECRLSRYHSSRRWGNRLQKAGEDTVQSVGGDTSPIPPDMQVTGEPSARREPRAGVEHPQVSAWTMATDRSPALAFALPTGRLPGAVYPTASPGNGIAYAQWRGRAARQGVPYPD
jgi:hypothetical protein